MLVMQTTPPPPVCLASRAGPRAAEDAVEGGGGGRLLCSIVACCNFLSETALWRLDWRVFVTESEASRGGRRGKGEHIQPGNVLFWLKGLTHLSIRFELR